MVLYDAISGVSGKPMKIDIKPLAVSAVLLFAAGPAAFGQGSGPKDLGGNWRMEQGSCIGNISIGAAPNAPGINGSSNGSSNWSGRYSAQCGGNSSVSATYQISAAANGDYHFTGTLTSGGSAYSDDIVLAWTADGHALVGTGTLSAQGNSQTLDVTMHH